MTRSRGRPIAHAQLFGEHTADWREQEKVVARTLDASRVPGSGSGFRKGDVDRSKQRDYLIECKGTDAASLSVKGEWLGKISKEARAAGRRPALQIEIRGHSEPGVDTLWVAIPLSDFQRLVDEAADTLYKR